ncbi:MAG TPA: hypothetical protein VFT12_05790 [Thermoanaerobaculia bacterium]|nr:hypothetical protein [Thermoanaerobaculia bacterium]
MRSAFVALLCLAVVSPLVAEPRRAPFAPQPELNLTFVPNDSPAALKAFASARAALKHSAGGVGAAAIADNRSARLILIPVVGNAPASGGTHYRSDITFVNWNVSSQRVQFIYMPSGNPGGTIIATGTLPGDRPPFTIIDFVGSQLQATGIGGLLILPVDAADDFDDSAAIDAHSRIYTNAPQPNTTRGTVSMQFPGIDPSHLQGEYEAVVLGLRQDADFRTNVGIVNLESFPITFSVLMVPESAPPGTQLTEVSITVQALSMIQQALPADRPGPFNLIVGVEQDIPNDDQWWTTYAASVDNYTHDGWVAIGATILDDEGLDDRGF